MLAPPSSFDAGALGTALARLFGSTEPDLQRLAAVVAAHRRFSIVAGGPGTGKTTTVARLIALLQEGDDLVRVEAAMTLAEFGRRAAAAVPALRVAERSPMEELRSQATMAIARIRPEYAAAK